MALVIPANNQWADAAQAIGGAATGAYIHHHDEAALRASIEKLGPNASARDIVDTITNTKTYSPKAKQTALKNYIGVAEFEELQRKSKASEANSKEANDIARDKNTAKANELTAKAEEKKKSLEEQKASADELIDHSSLSQEEKNRLKGKLVPADARALLGKNENTSEYDIAKNHAKRFEKSIETYQSQAIEAEQLIPLTESAIVKNEAYGLGEKAWDTILDSINSPILNPLKTKTGQELEAYTPISISAFGQKMSGQLTNQKINIISKKAIGLGKR